MKKITLVFICALASCALFAGDKSAPKKSDAPVACKTCSKDKKVAKKVCKKAGKKSKLELRAESFKMYPQKIGVLSVNAEEKNIVLSFGGNDGLKEEQPIILYSAGKPMLEVVVTELSDDQTSATFVQGDSTPFTSGEHYNFAIPAAFAK